MSKDSNFIKLQSPQVVVVEASAGSGKTYTLAKRYLQLLIDSETNSSQIPLRSILAITFTNKAMIEMKKRIIDFLKKIALGLCEPEVENDLLSLFGLNKGQAREKAELIMDSIIQHYSFFQIQTIDSFINTLLLGCSLNIDRSPSFKIKRDYREHISYCLDLVIEQAHSDVEIYNFMEEFLQHYIFVENRNSWFPREDILDLVDSIFKLANKYGRKFSGFKGNALDVIKKKKSIYKFVQELVLLFPHDMNLSAKKHINNFLVKNKDIFDISTLPAVMKKPFPPMNKKTFPGDDFKSKWQKMHTMLKGLIEFDSKVAYNPYIQLFGRIFKFFESLCKKEDILFLEELNRQARLIFDHGQITVAELYYRLATRYKHYLIDEFQDTSVLQWSNLRLMVEEALSSGGTFFYVGDKKQAIYRFRGGEAQLFDKVSSEFEPFNINSIHLTKNFRSQKVIVEFNNRIFSSENLEDGLISSQLSAELQKVNGIDEVKAVFCDAVQEVRSDKSRGYVYLENLSESNLKERDELMRPKIIDLVRNLSKRYGYEDIAILVRNNNEVELVTSWLLEENITVESEKTLNVVENSLIKEIISLLKFLRNPYDDLNFSSFILGDIFLKTASQTVEQIRSFIFSLNRRRASVGPVSIYEIFSKDAKYRQFSREYLCPLLDVVGMISPYELVILIYNKFNLIEDFFHNQAFFMKFLELIRNKEDEYIGLGAFLGFIESEVSDDLYVNVAQSSSLKVLTVHKAKGLEFPVVIIPFLRMDINPETGGKGTSSYVIEADDDKFGMIRITKNHKAFSEFLSSIYAQALKKACIDELNNTYVALTRAQEELYIFIPAKSSGANNKIRFFMPDNITELGSRTAVSKDFKVLPEYILIPACTYKDWSKILYEDSLDVGEIVNKDKMKEGEIMHLLLCGIANCYKKDIAELIDSALIKVKAKFKIDNISYYEKRAKELIETKYIQDVFFVKEGDVFCEREVVDFYGDSRRIDRLIIKSQEVLIVDYKLASEVKDKNSQQINEYKEIIRTIYPGVKVRGFLLYLDSKVMREVVD